MQAHSPAIRPIDRKLPTVWGLDPVQLHDRFWAARGVCVVRPGERTPLPRDAHLFLLTDAHTLALFPLRAAVDHLYWIKPAVLFVRVRENARKDYRELVREDEEGRFIRFERHYGNVAPAVAHIALTRDRRVTERWQATDGSQRMWREFRRQTRQIRRETLIANGRCYDRRIDAELEAMMFDLVQRWRVPSTTVEDIREMRPGVWGHAHSRMSSGTRVVGRTWVGVGRRIEEPSIVGPTVLWDDPAHHPVPSAVRWDQIEPTPPTVVTVPRTVGRTTLWRRASQRSFDIAFAILALMMTLPLYPFIMLAIWLEDGRPFIFGHRRETRGGREFSCLKFRSMRKDADAIKKELARKNQADGPQFFIESDPRVTRVGRFLRKTNLDELPQFINVLLGQMSVVGPRPSPRNENQFCPAWREARLSVRPGITGLWQVSRTRRQGFDFQEWIRFDLEYVEKANLRLDLWIILKTIQKLLKV